MLILVLVGLVLGYCIGRSEAVRQARGKGYARGYMDAESSLLGELEAIMADARGWLVRHGERIPRGRR